MIGAEHRMGQATEQPIEKRGLKLCDSHHMVGVHGSMAKRSKAQQSGGRSQGLSPAASRKLKHENAVRAESELNRRAF